MNNRYIIMLDDKDDLSLKVNIEAIGRDYIKGFTRNKKIYVPHNSILYMIEDRENLEDDENGE